MTLFLLARICKENISSLCPKGALDLTILISIGSVL